MPEDSKATSSREAAKEKFKQLLDERIAAKRYTSAARLVREAIHRHIAPSDDALPDWLGNFLDRGTMDELIRYGFSPLSSSCCDTGFEPCDSCHGTGHRGVEGCLDCLTIGWVRCPFCNGSSLVPYSDLPSGLRKPILLARLHVASEHALAMNESIPDISCEPSVVVELKRLIMNCDKLLGVLENVAIELRHAPAGALPREEMETLGKAAIRLRRITLAAFSRLGECWGERASAGGDEVLVAEARCATLRELGIRKSLADTKLAHPFLFKEDRPTPPANLEPEASLEPHGDPSTQPGGAVADDE